MCYAGDYAKALSFIAALGDELALDPVLAPHASALKEKAVDRLIAQYCKPYKTVDLGRMAAAFSLDQSALEDRVARLVGAGSLGDLRVDLVKKDDGGGVVPRHVEKHFAELAKNGWKNCRVRDTHTHMHTGYFVSLHQIAPYLILRGTSRSSQSWSS